MEYVVVFLIAVVGSIGLALWLAAESERKQKEEARLAPKREELKVLKVETERKDQKAFLDPMYRERYAYQHHFVVRRDWPEVVAGYDRWRADPDFKALASELSLGEMLRVWEAKEAVLAFANDLSKSDLESWEAKEFEMYQEAVKRGVTTKELPRILGQEYRAEVREREKKVRKWFEEGVLGYLKLEAKDLEAGTAEGGGLSELDKKVYETLIEVREAVTKGVLAQIVDPSKEGEEEVVRLVLFGFLHVFGVAKVGSVPSEIRMVRSQEEEFLRVARGCFGSGEELAEMCEIAERRAFGVVRNTIDMVREMAEERFAKSDLEEPLFKVWAEEYKARLGEVRTKKDFLAIIWL